MFHRVMGGHGSQLPGFYSDGFNYIIHLFPGIPSAQSKPDGTLRQRLISAHGQQYVGGVDGRP